MKNGAENELCRPDPYREEVETVKPVFISRHMADRCLLDLVIIRMGLAVLYRPLGKAPLWPK